MLDWLHDMLLNPSSVGQKILVMVVAVALFAVVIGIIMLVVNMDKAPQWLVALGFIGPVLLLIAVGLVYPFIRTLFESFRNFNGVGVDTGWSGLSNYAYYFTGAGHRKMLINTVMWVFLVPIFATAFGLVYSVLVDRTRGEKWAKALIFLPTAISMVAASVAWKYIYYTPAPQGQSQTGLLNAIVTLFGGSASQWTVKNPQGTFALIVVMIWIQAGFAMTLLSAAIKAVPDDIVEAARIDGASGPKLFWKVTIPSIRPTLIVVLSTVAITSLKAFDVVATMGGNLPGNDILANAFRSAQATQQYGRAGSAAVLIFICVLPVIIYNIVQMRKSEAIR